MLLKVIARGTTIAVNMIGARKLREIPPQQGDARAGYFFAANIELLPGISRAKLYCRKPEVAV